MNLEHARRWLATVLGGLAGWINLRAIDPDQQEPPRTAMVREIEEALTWCHGWEGSGRNLYAGLARRGEGRDERGSIDASERNLLGANVLWADLDDGTREEQLARVAAFPVRPTMLVDSGGGLHPLWQLEIPIECCAAGTDTNAKLRRVLKGIQLAIGGDPAVVDPSRIFRIAGTRNYPNARKRARGRVECDSGILEHGPYRVTLEDFAEYEEAGAAAEAEAKGAPVTVTGHAEKLPIAVAHVLEREPRMKRVFFCEERLQDGDASAEDYALAVGILRRAPWLASDRVIEALRYRRVALAHLVRGSHKSRSYYASTVKKARERLDAEAAAPDFDTSPGRWFQFVLGKAITAQPKPVVQDELVTVHEPPRIDTGVTWLDHHTHGGIYGFTALAGDSGVGKSTIAFNTALRAKQLGWKTLYIAAEMDAQDYQDRAVRYYGIPASGILAKLPTIAHVSDGVQLEAIYDLVMTLPDDQTERILLVIDSLTKVAAYTDPGGGGYSFFESMNKLTRMCEAAVRNGERRICALVTSELNKDRQALGMRIIYSASLVVQLSQDRDNPDSIHITIPKARYSAKTKPFGPYRYEWQSHRLKYMGTEEVPRENPIEEPAQRTEDIQNDLMF